jgi:hypothetical protein
MPSSVPPRVFVNEFPTYEMMQEIARAHGS